MNYTISLDADETRVVWQVILYDDNGDVIKMVPFRDWQDAHEYAEEIIKHGVVE